MSFIPPPDIQPPPQAGYGEGFSEDDLGLDEFDINPDPSIPSAPFTFNCPKELLGKGSKQKRQKIADQICNMLDADDASRGTLTESADQVDEIYLGREVESLKPLWDDAPTYNANTMRVKIHDLVAYIIGPIVQNDPYFILRAGGPKGNPNEQVQTVLHYFMHRGGWPLAIDEACNLVARRGRCPMRVTYEPKRMGRRNKVVKPKFKFEPIDTRFFPIYPNNAKDFDEARLMGHLDQCRVQEIAEAQKRTDYFDDVKIVSSSDKRLSMGNQEGDKQQAVSNAAYEIDHTIDRFTGLVKLDLDGDGYEELYHVVVARQQRVLLQCEEHQLDKPNYGDHFFERETGRYFPEATIGTDLVGPHHFTNDTLNIQMQATVYNAVPPIFGEDWALPDEVITTRPGEVTSIERGGNIVQGGGKLDLGMFPGLHELARRIADEVSHISQNAAGSQFRNGTTATEASQVWQGQMNGISSLSRKFGHGCTMTAEVVMEYLYWNFDDWYPEYKDDLPVVKREDFCGDYWITVYGESPNSAPAAVMQQITQFLQSLFPVLQADPSLLQRCPDLISGLVRAFLDSTTIPGKESILPTREEEAANAAEMQRQAMMEQINAAVASAQGQGKGNGQANAGGSPTPLSAPGMGLPMPTMGATPAG